MKRQLEAAGFTVIKFIAKQSGGRSTIGDWHVSHPEVGKVEFTIMRGGAICYIGHKVATANTRPTSPQAIRALFNRARKE